MKDEAIKSKRMTREETGVALPSMGISSKYWEAKKAQQERWAKEDAEKQNKK